MMGKNHLITNTCTGILTAEAGITLLRSEAAVLEPVRTGLEHGAGFFHIPEQPVLVGLYAAFVLALLWVGALLPDIDHPNSIFGQRLHLRVEHRTITHAIWPVMGLAACGVLLHTCFFFLAYGYLIHLLFDSISVGGICWFWPLQKYRSYPSGAKVTEGWHLKLYRAGAVSEAVVTWTVVGFTVGITVCFIVTQFM